MRTSFASIALLSGLAGACGGFAEDPSEPNVLVTLQGEVTIPNDVDAPEDLRVALVWHGKEYRVAHELELVPEFPVRYALQVDRLPPDDVLVDSEETDAPPGVRLAYGFVVGYSDENGNDRLDMVDVGAESFVDRLVAANRDLIVIYVEGSDAGLDALEREALQRIPRGFSLVDVGVEPDVVLPAGSAYDLPIDSDPRLNELMCRSYSDAVGAGAIVVHPEQPAAYPAPDDPTLTCAPGGSSYRLLVCTETQEGPCRETIKSCTSDEWRRPDPIPAGWPCPE